MKLLQKLARTYAEAGLSGIVDTVSRKLRGVKKPKLAWDEYLDWLSYAVPGMMARGNVDCFDYAISHLPSHAPVVEIGSFCGLSTCMLVYLKERHSMRNALITCDRWSFEGPEAGSMLGDSQCISRADYREFVRGSYNRNIGMFCRSDLPYTLELFSDEFFAAWAVAERRRDILDREILLGGPISFAYIDGNHSYDFARRDFENTDRFLEPGGFILFDDSADGSDWEVCRVVKEVEAMETYELVAKTPNYFFRKRR
jgi:hypothetical protein